MLALPLELVCQLATESVLLSAQVLALPLELVCQLATESALL